MSPRVVQPEMTIVDKPWAEIRGRVNRLWSARESPHHSIMGQTRSGKSYLVCHGILDLCKWDRVLIIDVKGDDQTLSGTGKPVRQLPGWMRGMRRLIEEDRPRDNWYRLVTWDDWERARQQVHQALETVYRQGEWVVVIDELRAIVDPQPPGLRLRGDWERLMLRGGSRGVSVVNSTQEPRWVPGSFYTQPSFVWVSRVEDERAQQRLTEIGSSRALLPHLQTIPKRQWLYMDNMEADRYWARTMVTRNGR